MSLAAAWLLANAELINTSSDTELWKMSYEVTQQELKMSLGCVHSRLNGDDLWCVGSDSLWMVTSLFEEHYVRRFALSRGSQGDINQSSWFGQGSHSLEIDSQRIHFYQSQHTADALVRGYRLRNTANIKFYREIEHGRYHLVTTHPATDIFVVQQG